MTPKQLREAANRRPYGCVCPPGKRDTACSAHNPLDGDLKPGKVTAIVGQPRHRERMKRVLAAACPHLHRYVEYLAGLVGEPLPTVVTCLGCGAVLHDGRLS